VRSYADSLVFAERCGHNGTSTRLDIPDYATLVGSYARGRLASSDGARASDGVPHQRGHAHSCLPHLHLSRFRVTPLSRTPLIPSPSDGPNIPPLTSHPTAPRIPHIPTRRVRPLGMLPLQLRPAPALRRRGETPPAYPDEPACQGCVRVALVVLAQRGTREPGGQVLAWYVPPFLTRATLTLHLAHWSRGYPLTLVDWIWEAAGRRRDFCTWAGLSPHLPARCPALPGAVDRNWDQG
jgi:hypothetical protein